MIIWDPEMTGKVLAMIDDFDEGSSDELYAEYIMENADPEVYLITNGNALTEAMEDGYLMRDFLASRAKLLGCNRDTFDLIINELGWKI